MEARTALHTSGSLRTAGSLGTRATSSGKFLASVLIHWALGFHLEATVTFIESTHLLEVSHPECAGGLEADTPGLLHLREA